MTTGTDDTSTKTTRTSARRGRKPAAARADATTTTRKRPGRKPASERTPARRRRRDRIREAATGRTLGMTALAVVGAIATTALARFGIRKADERRMAADPTAKPIAEEIREAGADAIERTGASVTRIADAARDALPGGTRADAA